MCKPLSGGPVPARGYLWQQILRQHHLGLRSSTDPPAHRQRRRSSALRPDRPRRVGGQRSRRAGGGLQPADALHHESPHYKSRFGRPAVHRLLRSLHGHRLRAAFLAVRRRVVQGGPVLDSGDCLRQRLHSGADVPRPLPGRGTSNLIDGNTHSTSRPDGHRDPLGDNPRFVHSCLRQPRNAQLQILRNAAHRVCVSGVYA